MAFFLTPQTKRFKGVNKSAMAFCPLSNSRLDTVKITLDPEYSRIYYIIFKKDIHSIKDYIINKNGLFYEARGRNSLQAKAGPTFV